MTTHDEIRAELRRIIPAGLVYGVGERIEGGLCIQAAIAWAAGEEHGDEPSCVADPDREYAIRINDAPWSSPQARAEALLPLALAQVGTAGDDRSAWGAALVEGTIRRVLPMAFDAAANAHPEEPHRAALRAAAERCRREGTQDAAQAAATAADNARVSAHAAVHAAHAAAHAAADAAGSAADAAAMAARAAAHAAAYAANRYASADAAVTAATAARYAAGIFAARNAAARDAILRESVQVALDAYAMEGR